MTATRTRVKICGITRIEDAQTAEGIGVDALGFVFVPASKRYIEPLEAVDIVGHLHPFTTTVGLFLDAPASEVERVLALIPGMLPQFHGRESGEYCDGFNRPYIKAVGVGSTMPTAHELSQYKRARGFLFDSNEPGALGGTGHAFDWTRLNVRSGPPLILAGGLNAGNVQSAISMVKPYAVDVSSGVESAKGIKDSVAMQQFMQSVADADARLHRTNQITKNQNNK